MGAAAIGVHGSGKRPRHGNEDAAKLSNGAVTSDAGHFVEVGVVASEIGHAVALHHGEDESIAAKDAVLTAQVARQENVLDCYRQHMNAGRDDVIQSQPKSLQLLDLARVLAEPVSDPFIPPSQTLAGFERHQPMGDITQ
jgi:hypothetical protein